MSFDNLKRNRAADFDKLNSEISKLNSKNFNNDKDDRYWTLTRDKSGNGYAIIRFLPKPDGEVSPFVKIWSHSFKDVGGWYIEKSLCTIDKPDPVMEENGRLWNSGVESNKEIAGKRKRKLKFHSNIYVVSDPANPENEGKVFLYEYGKKVFDKINDAMNPAFPDDPKINPFDMWEGANFKLRVRTVDDWPNYDKCEFEDPSQLADDDKLREIYENLNSLQELLDPKHYKSYDDLKKRFDKVVGAGSNMSTTESSSTEELLEKLNSQKSEAPKHEEVEQPKQNEAKPTSDDDDDDDLDFFKNLVDD